MLMRRKRVWPLFFVVLTTVIGCSKDSSVASTDYGQDKAVSVSDRRPLATVNGKPIFEQDVQYWLHRNTRGRVNEGTPEQIQNVLEAIIDQELILQRAQALGLDRNQPYQQKIRIKQAELDSLRRTEIRQVFYRYQAKEASKIDSAEIKAYFDRHESAIKTQYHILQIRKRSEADINEVKRRLDNGTSFEKIAAEPYQSMPKSAGTPWDLGYLDWAQIPAPWRSAIANLEIGATSDVLKGFGRLFWIIKLIDKRTDQEANFEKVRPMIEKAIQANRIENLRGNTTKQLRERAEITYASSMHASLNKNSTSR